MISLQDTANLANIGQLLLAVVVTFGGTALAIQYIKTLRPVWKRFADNVTREIAVVSTEKQPMEHEAEVLERVGFFKVRRVAADVRKLNMIQGVALLVVGYSPDSKVYKETLAYAKAHDLPIVVFAGKNHLPKADFDELKQYTYSSLCETELRLVSDVFAIISTFPHRLPR